MASSALVTLALKFWPLLQPLLVLVLRGFVQRLKDEADKGQLHESLGQWSDEVSAACDVVLKVLDQSPNFKVFPTTSDSADKPQ